MKRILAIALLTCLAAPAWADPPVPEWVRAASRCTNLTPNCNPFADMMSDADLAVFRYLTVYSIFDLPPKELRLAVDKVEKAVAAARSRSKTACEDADRVIKLMQRGASRAVRRHADELVAFVMEPNCQ
ncbi:hypothetical protein V7R83_09790 [Lautropia mirabilis ATCC 51599]|jgi:hypothetical protein|nr:hypothetical protein [Lautropia mirabilis]VEH01233.1 Uncharacterised protein [Lautropia mirabilis]